MLWVKVKTVVILFVLCNFRVKCEYSVPQPEIIVHTPSGFSVSIPHVPGIEIFAFHGNINRELIGLGAGEFSIDIRKHENGKWTFRNFHRKLRPGDVIYYWLFVIKNGLGYRFDGGRYRVPGGDDLPPITPGGQEIPESAPKENQPCLEAVLNLTQTLLQQQARMNALQLTNLQMRNYIEEQSDGRKLTMSGKIPPDGAASASVSFILRERLDLNPVIISADWNDNGSITFEVASVEIKLEILQEAKKKLVATKVSIK